MSAPFEVAGAQGEPSAFAPLYVNRMLTGMWTNTNPLRDAGSSLMTERFYGGRQDAMTAGLNCEITPKQTLKRRPGLKVYNSQNFPPINRFYSFNTFTLTKEAVRVIVDTDTAVYDATGPNTKNLVWQKSAGANSTYFLGVGNTLYFTNGLENKQWSYNPDTGAGAVLDWGLNAPVNAPTIFQQVRPNNYPSWEPGTAYQVSSAALSGIVILDDLTNIPSNAAVIPTAAGGEVLVMCGQNFSNGASIALPSGFDTTRLLIWTTPGIAFDGSQTTPGVFSSKGNGGILQSFFQNRSGGSGFPASTNWIAIAWNAASGATLYSSGNYSGINFHTLQGDNFWIQVGFGVDQSTLYVPSGSGVSLANSLHMLGAISCENVDHAMQGIWKLHFSNDTTLNVTYTDDQGYSWHGNAAVFSVFWTGGISAYTESIANGTALRIPTGGTNEVAMIFATMHNTDAHGLPSGYSASQFVETCAMGEYDWGTAGSNRAHGWTAQMASQTLTASLRDSEGNYWYSHGMVFAIGSLSNAIGGNVQFANGTGVTGAGEPQWNQTVGGTTPDNTVTWTNLGPSRWQANHYYAVGSVVMGVVTSVSGTPNQIYVAIQPGTSGTFEPHWPSGVNIQKSDGEVIWQCLGQALSWNDIGSNTTLSAASTIVDPNGYLQDVLQSGVTGTTTPPFGTDLNVTTNDNTVIWKNAGSFAPESAGDIQYGYTFQISDLGDQSNMSPASVTVTVQAGNQVVVQGVGSGQPGVDTINIYRTLPGQSTFVFVDSIANPGEGQTWTYTDNVADNALDITLQAPVQGENTPLEAGASCLEYHMGRVWAAVGNVVWASSGPDADASASNGNTGFDTSFTVQSKITRLWANSIGLCVFTVNDAYIILGDGYNNQFAIRRWVENLPLLSYDAFTVQLTNAILLTGNHQVIQLDPGGGVLEISFPICDLIANEYPPESSYLSYHTGVNAETAVYVADGETKWIRLNSLNAPDGGQAWNPPAKIIGGTSAVQSVEILPGTRMLLVGPPASGGPILVRDLSTHADNGAKYQMTTYFGNINLASPGKLAGVAWLTIEGSAAGSMPELSVLMGEIDGRYEPVKRTRQDPPNLPPSTSILANRHHMMQGQNLVWCRHMMIGLEWPDEDAPSELYAYTIFGQIWQEMRTQQ